MRIVDTHAHLQFPKFSKDLDEVVERFKNAGGVFLLNVGINLKDSKEALKVAKKYGFKVSVGVHPHDSKDVSDDYIQKLQNLAMDEDVVAIGETGLDYYRDFSPRDVQKRVFQEQIDLATLLNKPLVVHIRSAYRDAYEILSTSQLPDPPGVIHAFSADYEWALKFVKLGFLIGIGGPVTYPKNEKLREVVKKIGLKNIVTETDCPYLPPQQFRGKRNEPSYVFYVLKFLAGILEMDLESVAEEIYNNTVGVFL